MTSATRVAPKPLISIRQIVREAALVFCAYYFAGVVGLTTTAMGHSNIGPIWPAFGIGLAAIVLCGYRILPVIAVAALLVSFRNPAPHLVSVCMSAATLLAITAGSALLKAASFDSSLSRLRDVLALIAFGAVLSTLISSGLGTSILYATNSIPLSQVASTWLVYWLGNSAGVLLITPVALTLGNPSNVNTKGRLVEFAALLLATILACAILFGELPILPLQMRVFAFAVFPFGIWAATRFGVAGASRVTFVIAAIATITAAMGLGPFVQGTPYLNGIYLDVFFAVISVSGLVLGATVAEREQAEKDRERLTREQAAIEERLHLAVIVECSNAGIITTDLDRKILSWNAGATKFYGYSAEEAIGQSIAITIPEERVGNELWIPERIKNGFRIDNHETLRKRKDGSLFDISITLSPMKNAAGAIIGVSSFMQDITERKLAEHKVSELRDQLTHLGRVGMMGVLTAGLAHELNQPLTAIRLNAVSALRLLPAAAATAAAQSEVRESLNDIQRDGERAGSVLQQMRTLLKKEPTHYENVDLDAAVADVCKLMRNNLTRQGIDLGIDFQDGCRSVFGDRVQIQQVILNLLINACDAVGQNIKSRRQVRLKTIARGDLLAVEVSDSGRGLADAEMARIFEPFYTTKPDGMGLGLSICRAIVTTHGGTLEASRNPGGGMTFAATFRRWQPEAMPSESGALLTSAASS